MVIYSPADVLLEKCFSLPAPLQLLCSSHVTASVAEDLGVPRCKMLIHCVHKTMEGKKEKEKQTSISRILLTHCKHGTQSQSMALSTRQQKPPNNQYMSAPQRPPLFRHTHTTYIDRKEWDGGRCLVLANWLCLCECLRCTWVSISRRWNSDPLWMWSTKTRLLMSCQTS